MKRFSLACLALLPLALLPGWSHALGRLLDVRVIDRDTGQVLAIHRHQGRHHVAGRPGARYAVQLRNTRGERLLAVISVDGINAVTGDTAAWHQSGYVLGPWQRHAVAGWRKSLDDIAAFEFTALPDAYATRTGRPDHVGVIGVAVFRERPAQARQAPAESAAPASPAPAARLGTGHGQREIDRVGTTTFERARPEPDELIVIHYDSRENLVARGILPAPAPRQLPLPFPDSMQAGFVPDPPAR